MKTRVLGLSKFILNVDICLLSNWSSHQNLRYPNLHGRYWWIGAELKSGTWYWEHSKKQVTYWSKIGGNAYDTSSNPYCAIVYISKTTAYWNYVQCGQVGFYPSICQISVMNKWYNKWWHKCHTFLGKVWFYSSIQKIIRAINK